MGQSRLGNAAAEKDRVLMAFNKEREQWKEREEELMTTNRLLDDELSETQGNVNEFQEKVAVVTLVLILILDFGPRAEDKFLVGRT